MTVGGLLRRRAAACAAWEKDDPLTTPALLECWPPPLRNVLQQVGAAAG